MEFSPAQWAGLRKHADERGLLFLSSPFSLAAVELLRGVGVAGWKIASGEISHDELVDACAVTRQPVILSTGMSAWPEIDAAVARVKRSGAPLAVLQCATRYPCPPEDVGIENVAVLRERYGVAAGLSDHSGTIFPAIAAATLGAEFVEVHVALSREMFGPDVVASVTTAELRELVRGVRFVEAMRAHPVDKSAVAADVAPLRAIFGRSIVAAEDLPAGTRLARHHLAFKKPGSGLPPQQIDRVVGRRLRRALSRDTLLADDDFAAEEGDR
jgi:N-acetylneuraminate synthase